MILSAPDRYPVAPRVGQAGVGLIEVLIAVLVFAIGLLGLARLETVNLATNHGSQLRSQAMTLTYDILDRMRANRDVALNGGYDIALGDAAPSGTTVVATDLQQWKAASAGQLPQGDGAIARTVASGVTRFLVTVQWDDSRGVDPPIQFVIDTEL